MRTCRYCDKLIDGLAAKTFSYWGHYEFECHPQCKAEGEKMEAFECQTVDADCNDCRHFKRGNFEKRWLSCMEDKLPSMRLVNMGFSHGHCLKLDKPTVAQPNKWSGYECFEHRRS